MAVWWTLYLDEDRQFTTHPGSTTCWDQALFYASMPRHDGNGGVPTLPPLLQAKAGDDVRVNVVTTDAMLQVEASVQAAGGTPAAAVAAHRPKAYTGAWCTLSEKMMCQLNDGPRNAGYNDAIVSAIRFLRSARAVTVLDLCEGFSLTPFMAVRAGAEVVRSAAACSPRRVLGEASYRAGLLLQVHARGPRDAEETRCLRTLADKLCPARGPAVEFWVPSSAAHPAPGLEQLLSSGPGCRKYDMVVADIVEPGGLLQQRVLENLAYVQCFLSGPAVQGVLPPLNVLPVKIDVVARVVESHALQMHTCVDAKRVLGFDVSPMGAFWVDTYPEIDAENLPHKRLTDDVVVLSIDLQRLGDDALAAAAHAGPGSAGIVSRSSTTRIVARQSGNATAVLYWFRLHLDASGTNVLCTGPVSKTSGGGVLCPSWRQAAVLLEQTRHAGGTAGGGSARKPGTPAASAGASAGAGAGAGAGACHGPDAASRNEAAAADDPGLPVAAGAVLSVQCKCRSRHVAFQVAPA